MSVRLAQIWEMDDEMLTQSIEILKEKKYYNRTESENKKVKLYSMIFDKKNIISDDYIGRHLLELLEENDGNLEEALESYTQNLPKYQEEEVKANNSLHIYGQDRLEQTFKESMDDICPLDKEDDGNFYERTKYTNGRKILSAHHLFQLKGHCYNINDIYRYINEGGHIDMREQYMLKFFNKNNEEKDYLNLSNLGKISDDFKAKGITQGILEDTAYYNNVKVLNISNNNIVSLTSLNLPDKLIKLNASNNPIKHTYNVTRCLKLVDISLSTCSIIGNFRCEELPQSIVILDMSKNNINEISGLNRLVNLKSLNVSENKNLNVIPNISELTQLIFLDITNTNITSISLTKLAEKRKTVLKIRCNKSLIQYQASKVKGKKNIPIPNLIELEVI